MIDQTAVFEKGKMVVVSSGGNAWRKGLGLGGALGQTSDASRYRRVVRIDDAMPKEM